jgi:hypothetical protein
VISVLLNAFSGESVMTTIVLDRQSEKKLHTRRTRTNADANADADNSIDRFYRKISKLLEGASEHSKLAKIQEKRDQIDNEILILKKSIYFFENVVSVDECEFPELPQFKKRLKQAKTMKKGLDLALMTCP